MPKRKRTEQLLDDASPEPSAVRTRPKRAASQKQKKSEEAWDYPDVAAEDSPLTDLDEDSAIKSMKKKGKGKRKRKNDEPVVYDIPPVERKTTDFTGRLGYACLNTVLRVLKPEPVFCSRTCRKDTIHKNGIDFAKDLGLKNARDLKRLVEWNEETNIRFLRVSSEMFPFASHGELGYDLEYAKEELKAVGDLAKKLGHRLTTHPGQFTQLASPKEAVIEASIRELEYHCQMFRHMGLGLDSVIILHMGGVYNDKPGTLERFKHTFRNKLTDEMRQRLVMENDEMCYSVDDLLPVCEELGVPIVLDYHHNWIKPSSIPLSTLIPRINAIWLKKGIKPKQHLSSPKPQFADGSGNVMDRRAHADRCYELPAELGITFKRDGSSKEEQADLMIEAKDKEQAVFHLYRIYDLQPVKHENLRPEKPQLVSSKSSKALEADDAEDVALLVGVEADGEMEAGTRRTRAKSAVRMKTETTGNVPENGEDVEQETPKPKKRRNVRSSVPDIAQSTEVETIIASESQPISFPAKKSRSRKYKSKTSPRGQGQAVPMPSQDLLSLQNQEDVPQPVDGAVESVVEAEEHPEAVGAAVVDGDGCGVEDKPKKRVSARGANGGSRKGKNVV